MLRNWEEREKERKEEGEKFSDTWPETAATVTPGIVVVVVVMTLYISGNVVVILGNLKLSDT